MIIEMRKMSTRFRVEKYGSRRTIVGHSAVFNKESTFMGFTEKIVRGAFTDALKNSDARALFNHNPDHVLGRESAGTLRLRQDENGLLSEIDLPDTQAGRDVAKLIARGDVREQSFGFIVDEDRWEDLRTKNPKRIIVNIRELRDVGPVTFAAYPNTDVALKGLRTIRNGMKIGTQSDPLSLQHARLKKKYSNFFSADKRLHKIGHVKAQYGSTQRMGTLDWLTDRYAELMARHGIPESPRYLADLGVLLEYWKKKYRMAPLR